MSTEPGGWALRLAGRGYATGQGSLFPSSSLAFTHRRRCTVSRDTDMARHAQGLGRVRASISMARERTRASRRRRAGGGRAMNPSTRRYALAAASALLVACGGGSEPQGPALVVSPGRTAVLPSGQQGFTSAIVRAVDSGVAWSVVEAGGGDITS